MNEPKLTLSPFKSRRNQYVVTTFTPPPQVLRERECTSSLYFKSIVGIELVWTMVLQAAVVVFIDELFNNLKK